MGYITDEQKQRAKDSIITNLSSIIKHLNKQSHDIEQNLIGVLQSEFESGCSTSIDQAKIVGQECIVSLTTAIWQLENTIRKVKQLDTEEWVEDE